MTQGRSDHYVPQFILRRFRSKGTGRLFYAEKDAQWISARGVSRTFCEPDGDLLLKGPPAIKQEGGFAVLAGPPEYTTGLREHLSRLEDRWARAIKRLVEAVCRQHRSHARPSAITRLERAPPKHAEWCAHGKDYCIRQMIRSPDAGAADRARAANSDRRHCALAGFGVGVARADSPSPGPRCPGAGAMPW